MLRIGLGSSTLVTKQMSTEGSMRSRPQFMKTFQCSERHSVYTPRGTGVHSLALTAHLALWGVSGVSASLRAAAEAPGGGSGALSCRGRTWYLGLHHPAPIPSSGD